MRRAMGWRVGLLLLELEGVFAEARKGDAVVTKARVEVGAVNADALVIMRPSAMVWEMGAMAR